MPLRTLAPMSGIYSPINCSYPLVVLSTDWVGYNRINGKVVPLVARFSPAGVHDESYPPSYQEIHFKSSPYVDTALLPPSGDIYSGGMINGYNGSSLNKKLFHIDSTGKFDEGFDKSQFDFGNGLTGSYLVSHTIHTGKLYVSDFFTQFGGASARYFIRCKVAPSTTGITSPQTKSAPLRVFVGNGILSLHNISGAITARLYTADRVLCAIYRDITDGETAACTQLENLYLLVIETAESKQANSTYRGITYIS